MLLLRDPQRSCCSQQASFSTQCPIGYRPPFVADGIQTAWMKLKEAMRINFADFPGHWCQGSQEEINDRCLGISSFLPNLTYTLSYFFGRYEKRTMGKPIVIMFHNRRILKNVGPSEKIAHHWGSSSHLLPKCF